MFVLLMLTSCQCSRGDLAQPFEPALREKPSPARVKPNKPNEKI
jgi:hypothetical protein